MEPTPNVQPLPFDYTHYWAAEAAQLPWFTPWNNVLEWHEPYAQWFVEGTLNASHACLDVHVAGDRKHKIALHWEDEAGNKRTLTYQELYTLVNRFASAMHQQGIVKGDVIVIYMPLIPEAIAAMLAAARLGALHTVVFSGFGYAALRDRIIDVQAKMVITADYGLRRGKYIPLKDVVDQALMGVTCVQQVVVVKRYERPCTMVTGRDTLYEDFISNASDYIAPEPVESNHPLFVLYTSGSTGKPKGIMHSTGGYLTYVYSSLKHTFNIQEESVYWCTADVGWVTGHSYVVYGPLMHGATMVLYEGAPDFPAPDIWWQLIERYKVSMLYTSPTALRFFMKLGEQHIQKHNLSSLKVLGSVGEPINPQVWQWYNKVIGHDRCPIIDTWWQTETGGFMIAPQYFMDRTSLKPGSAMHPLPGIDADVVDLDGNPVPTNTKGFLVIRKPWPGMLLGFFKDHHLYESIYWSKFKGMYYSGDYAIKDADGCFWLLGRADEVIQIAGHRIGTAEIESATLAHPAVSETAAIGIDDSIKGETIVLFCVLRTGFTQHETLAAEVIAHIHKSVGKFIVVSGVYCVEALPKTRSGKIMRRVLKAMVLGTPLGDMTTMEDECVIDDVKTLYNAFRQTQSKDR